MFKKIINKVIMGTKCYILLKERCSALEKENNDIREKTKAQLCEKIEFLKEKNNEKVLEDELLQNMGSYIVVNKDQKISDSLKNNFSSNYEEVQIGGITGFTVYHKK